MLEHKLLIKYCLDKFYTEPLIKETTLPSTARVTVTESEKYRNLHVKVTFPEMRGEKQVIERRTSNCLCGTHRYGARRIYASIYRD